MPTAEFSKAPAINSGWLDKQAEGRRQKDRGPTRRRPTQVVVAGGGFVEKGDDRLAGCLNDSNAARTSLSAP